MTLCVDVGNTSIKCALVAGTRVGRVVAVPGNASPDEIGAAIVRAAGRAAIARAAVSSVRPATTARVSRAIRRELGIEPLVVDHRVRLPVAIATRHPERVGVDRICAAAAAVDGGSGDAIVVDAGTAITVDLVEDRRFLGGVILAGPQLSLSALHAFTAQLPDLALPSRAPARIDDTRAAMGWGAVLGAAGGILEAVAMLEARAGCRPARWLTGGYAPVIRPYLRGRWRIAPGLTLRGLAAISRLNAPSR